MFGVMGGLDDYPGIAEYGRDKHDGLKIFLRPPNPIPSNGVPSASQTQHPPRKQKVQTDYAAGVFAATATAFCVRIVNRLFFICATPPSIANVRLGP